MNKISVLMLSCSLFFSGASVSAENCTDALSQVNELIADVNLALVAKDIDAISDMGSEMKTKAQDILNKCDNCGCDDAYESTEVINDNADNVYLSDTVEEAKEYLTELKMNAELTITHLKKCDS